MHKCIGFAAVIALSSSAASASSFDTLLSKRLDASAANPSTGEMYFGAGNTLDHYMVQNAAAVDSQNGMKIHFRTGYDIAPTFVRNGRIHIVVPEGAQVTDPDRGVSEDKSNRAAWSLDYAINVSLDSSPLVLDNFAAVLRLDLDPGPGVSPLVLTMFRRAATPPAGQSGFGWKTATGQVVIDDDGGTNQITENSFNYAFIASAIDTSSADGIQPYAFGPASFTIQLTTRKKGQPIATNFYYDVDVVTQAEYDAYQDSP